MCKIKSGDGQISEIQVPVINTHHCSPMCNIRVQFVYYLIDFERNDKLMYPKNDYEWILV